MGFSSILAEPAEPYAVFINVPYAWEYEARFLALIASLSLHGVIPTAAVVAPRGATRLDRIINALCECPVSIHDLSWMELDPHLPATPRFNMPFELGIAAALSKVLDHQCVVLDTVHYRLDKALSDIKGVDPFIYDGTPLGIFRALANVFFRNDFRPCVSDFTRVLKKLEREAARIRKQDGYTSLYEALPFQKLRLVAADVAGVVRGARKVAEVRDPDVTPPLQ